MTSQQYFQSMAVPKTFNYKIIKIIFLAKSLCFAFGLDVCSDIRLTVFDACTSEYQLLKFPEFGACNAKYVGSLLQPTEPLFSIFFNDQRNVTSKFELENGQVFYSLYVYTVLRTTLKNLLLVVNIDEESLQSGHIMTGTSVTFFRNFFPKNQQITFLLLAQTDALLVDLEMKKVIVNNLKQFWQHLKMCNNVVAVFQFQPMTFIPNVEAVENKEISFGYPKFVESRNNFAKVGRHSNFVSTLFIIVCHLTLFVLH